MVKHDCNCYFMETSGQDQINCVSNWLSFTGFCLDDDLRIDFVFANQEISPEFFNGTWSGFKLRLFPPCFFSCPYNQRLYVDTCAVGKDRARSTGDGGRHGAR